jgi:hypothetical protein
VSLPLSLAMAPLPRANEREHPIRNAQTVVNFTCGFGQ